MYRMNDEVSASPKKSDVQTLSNRIWSGAKRGFNTLNPFVRENSRVARPQASLLSAFTFLFALAVALFVSGSLAQAQTDIATTVTSLTTLWNSIETLAILIVVFLIGRRMLRKT